ncbi:MAG: hypothetical protein ABSH48_20555 [Verrucomicrobiota bacterium]|jgi:hypothetical protein
MNPNLAEENLATIRLLMERAALYRRALAPIMLLAGILGLIAAAVGLFFHVESSRAFAGLWLGTACVVLSSAFLMARRQALKDAEPFWSPPTCRVAQAMLPPLVSGLFLGGLLALLANNWAMDLPMALIWLLFYGCALHSAGFFMVRGIKWFGWVFIIAAILLMILVNLAAHAVTPTAANWFMGLLFGGLHLAYGSYLYFTEKKASAA